MKLKVNVRPISFSIPDEKIISKLPLKIKDFPEHIVDVEIRKRLNKHEGYVFAEEAEYFKDLQASRFGITTKRAGWDCMRHYEIAANGAVICFKDLDLKPKECAPHDLVIGNNCISYRDFDDLTRQIQNITEEKYLKLQNGSWQWAKTKTCKALAERIMNELINIRN